MENYEKMLERFEKLWKRAEKHLEKHLPPTYRGNGRERPELKDLNTAVTLLKRVQDARMALARELAKGEATGGNESDETERHKAEADAARAARVLERLEDEEE